MQKYDSYKVGNQKNNFMEQETKNDITPYTSQNGLFTDACIIIEQAQNFAYRSVNELLIKRNWLLGMRIQHEVLKDKRAEYGEQVVKALAKDLTGKYGAGFTKTNLYNYICFYQTWPEFFHAASGKSIDESANFFHAVSGKSENIMDYIQPASAIRLSWTHYRIIMQETNDDARIWYENEAAKYLTYMPTKEELRREIEQQKEFFRLQHGEKNEEE